MATCNIKHPVSKESCLIDQAGHPHTHCKNGGVNCANGNSCTLNHVWVHNSSTNNISLDYTSYSTSFNDKRTELAVTFYGARLTLNNGYFNYHYKVFLTAVYKDEAGTVLRRDGFGQTTYYIDYQRTNNGIKTSTSLTNPWATWTTYDAPYLIGEHRVNVAVTQDKWGSISLGNVTKTLTSIPANTATIELGIYADSDPYYYWGCFDDDNDPNTEGTWRWHLALAEKGCPCTASGGKHADLVLATSIKKGTVSVTDNGNNTITITGTNATDGTMNPVASSKIKVQFNNQATATEYSLSVAAGASFTLGVNDYSSNNAIKIPKDATSVTVTLESHGTYLGSVSATTTKTVKYYDHPTAPTKMWVNTGKISSYTVTKNADGVLVKDRSLKSSYDYVSESAGDNLDNNNKIKPKVKDLLMWKWSGQAAGNTNTPVQGFRVYIYKDLPAGDNITHIDYSVDISSPYGVDTTNEGTAAACSITPREEGSTLVGSYHDIGIDAVNEKNTQYGFYPNNEGFAAKDICACKVYTYGIMGNNEKIFSKTYLLGRCELFNSAVVWVKTDVQPTVNGGWQEGIPYVKTSAGWKEAESVHVKNSSTTWKEST